MKRKKKSDSKRKVTIPLSVAVAALSSGMLLSNTVYATNVDQIHVKLQGETGYQTIDLGRMSTDPTYEADTKARLKAAFLDERNSIVIEEQGSGKKVEFGQNAHNNVSLDIMLQSPASYY